MPPVDGGASVSRFEGWLDHNELELALDELEDIGTRVSGDEQFWMSLLAAAENMGLPEHARRCLARVRECRTHGWTIPSALRRQDEDLYVFPWPGRDEAFVLFDIEDFGPAGPAAGELALLRGKGSPEILWQSGPFAIFLDEYWLGTAHSVSFSEGGGYAFARPYLRGRFHAAFLVLVRAADRCCAILETDFTVYRVEEAPLACVRVHAVPDPRIPLWPNHPVRSLDHARSRVFPESDLEWFQGSELDRRVRKIQSRAE